MLTVVYVKANEKVIHCALRAELNISLWLFRLPVPSHGDVDLCYFLLVYIKAMAEDPELMASLGELRWTAYQKDRLSIVMTVIRDISGSRNSSILEEEGQIGWLGGGTGFC